MNREQVEYTLLQIEEYNKEAEKYHKSARKNMLFSLCGWCLYVYSSFIFEERELSKEAIYISGILMFCGLFVGAAYLRKMLGNLTIKACCEKMINDLKCQIDMDGLADQENSNDKGLKLIP